MPSSPVTKVVEHLRKTVLRREEEDRLSDGQLLDRFLEKRDEVAFAALVRRHGSMVWGVCQRVVGQAADAEDAFQAAFLILVRKAAAVKPREAVGNWLYGVACHTALKARTACTKVRAKEKQVTSMPESAKEPRVDREELQRLLDQELSALPDKYRLPVVLCDLEGRTRKEVAAQLKIPEGTLSSRLATAHQMLAKRLARHGLAVSGGSLAALFAQNAASACVPAAVVSSTIKTATLVAASNGAVAGVVSTKVAALTEGVLKAMLMNKLNAVVAVVLMLGFIGTGATILSSRTAAARSDKPPIVEERVKVPQAGAKVGDMHTEVKELPTGKLLFGAGTKRDGDPKGEKVGFTAWGKEVGGLQAGLGFRPGEYRAYHHGETVTLVVRVRNVGKEEVKFQYLRQFFIETPPTVTDGNGKPVPPVGITALGFHSPVEVSLAPGKEIELNELKLELKPPSKSGYISFSTLFGTGKFQIQYERVFGNSSSGSIKLDPTLSKLATGKLELEIKSEVKAPQKQERPEVPDDVKPKGDAGGPVHSLPGHTDRLTSVAYSPDGKSIATAFWDGPDGKGGTARIWDAKTGKEERRLEFPATKGYNTFGQIVFSPDNAFIVTSVRESTDASVVIVWDRRTGEKVRTFPSEAGSVAVSPDGSLIACGGYRLIRLYEFATGKMVREIRGDEKQLRIASLTFSPDGKTLVSTGHPETPQRGDGVERLTLMPDVIRVWDVATGKERPSALNGLVVGRLGQRIALSPDGRTLLHPSGNDISLLETPTGKVRAKLTGHKNEVCDFAFFSDGRTMASGSMDGTVRLWDLPSGKEIGRFGKEVDPFKGGWVLAIAFSPDGRSLVSGGLNKTADIWDVSRITGRPRISAERSPAELEADWQDLGGDAAKAYAALGRLISSPKQAVPFLGKHLQSAKAPDTKRIEQLIGDLDDARFQVREQARKELEALGECAAPALRKALAGGPSLEASRRLDALLDRLDGARPSAETLCHIRAVEALESIGNPEALRLLEKLATGPPEMRLTQEALASARRLAKRSPDGP